MKDCGPKVPEPKRQPGHKPWRRPPGVTIPDPKIDVSVQP